MKKTLMLAVALAFTMSAGYSHADGAKLAKRKCGTCHDLSDKQKKKVGPPLWGVAGRPVASVEGFKYSGPMQDKGGVWDDANLDAFLTKPATAVRKTKMKFAGLKKDDERAAVIEYLHTLK
ncbi:MAG: c-type cytochrome [Magnetococcales bacterium]|nr:c-type cytochrome [Magnetococcales bacterium]